MPCLLVNNYRYFGGTTVLQSVGSVFSSRQESETPEDINFQQYLYKNINYRNYVLHADLDGKIKIHLFTK
jgi:hypothetical protein